MDAIEMIMQCRNRQDVAMDAELVALLMQEGLTGRGFEAADSPTRLPEEDPGQAHHPLDSTTEWFA